MVKEEISDDSAKLPCFNGRVVSWVRKQLRLLQFSLSLSQQYFFPSPNNICFTELSYGVITVLGFYECKLHHLTKLRRSSASL